MSYEVISVAGRQMRLLGSGEVFPRKAVVGCQGIKGAYSQQAARKMFPERTEMFFRSFAGVIEAVKSGLVDFGILPIENNSYGSVRGTYRQLQDADVTIVRGERLLIRHQLLVKPGIRLEDITSIRSHEQALGQCGAFIRSMEGKVPVIPVLNTAVAARYVAECGEPGAAAIASPEAAEAYGLETLESRVSDSDNNYTRFVCIGREPVIYPGASRISMILSAAHRPGALYEILGLFANAGLNLLKLESCPIVGRDFEFMFYTDVEGNAADPKVREVLSEVKERCAIFRFLGNYAEG